MTKKFSETKSWRDREGASWTGDANDDIARRVANSEDAPLFVKNKELIQGVDFDLMQASYPSTDTEVFTYSLNAQVVLTVTVLYQSPSKRNIDNITYVVP